jgi:hypothetical protein
MSMFAYIFSLLAIMGATRDSVRQGHGHQLRTPILNSIYQFVKEFSRVDTNYVEPQAYNFTVMLQNTNTYEIYRLRYEKGKRIVFSPKPSFKVGPYVGWRWIFLGYTIDFSRLGDEHHKQDLDLSLYSNQIGLDFFWRKSGDDYRISSFSIGKDYDMKSMKDVTFSGFKSSVKGFNLYYIFNHRKFSYPAAYSQSSIQRRSCGSPLVGIGYTSHRLSVDWQELRDLIEENMGSQVAVAAIDTSMTMSKINYKDYSVSGGYAYNWVFAHNWLFDISLSAALAYKRTTNDRETSVKQFIRDFDFKNFNFDAVSRLGLVYNNMRWYAGLSAVFHSYNYKKSKFSTNNSFGSVNVYVGYNFGKR